MSKNRILFKSGLSLILLSIISIYSPSTLANKTKVVSTPAPVSQEKMLSSNKDINKEASSAQSKTADKNVTPIPESAVNINKADAEELARKLRGIGVKKAKAIIEYRETFGDFKSVENIQEVPGIGPVFIEMNRDKIIL